MVLYPGVDPGRRSNLELSTVYKTVLHAGAVEVILINCLLRSVYDRQSKLVVS